MSMWQQIREEKEIKLSDFAKTVGYSKQNISAFEKGKRPMPMNLQIEYLKLRGKESDLLIINYLKERIEEKCINVKSAE